MKFLLNDPNNICLLLDEETVPSDPLKPWLKFGKTEEEWMKLVEECIKHLCTSQGLGRLNMETINQGWTYSEETVLKCYSYWKLEAIDKSLIQKTLVMR